MGLERNNVGELRPPLGGVCLTHMKISYHPFRLAPDIGCKGGTGGIGGADVELPLA